MPDEPKSFIRTRYLLLIVVIIFFGFFALSQSGSLKDSFAVLSSLQPSYIFVAGVAQVVSYLGSARILQGTLEIFSVSISLVRSLGLVVATSSIGVVAGGVVASAGAMYHFLHKQDVPRYPAASAGWIPDVVNVISLTLLSFGGIVALTLTERLTTAVLVGFGVALLILLLLVGVAMSVFMFPEKVHDVVHRIVNLTSFFRERRMSDKKVDAVIDSVKTALSTLKRGRWYPIVFGETVNVMFDLLTMYALFLSVGVSISFGLLIASYALPLLFGKIIPGGIGIVEGGMLGMYALVGIPLSEALVVVLGYRLFSLWIPLFVGFIMAGFFEWGYED